MTPFSTPTLARRVLRRIEVAPLSPDDPRHVSLRALEAGHLPCPSKIGDYATYRVGFRGRVSHVLGRATDLLGDQVPTLPTTADIGECVAALDYVGGLLRGLLDQDDDELFALWAEVTDLTFETEVDPAHTLASVAGFVRGLLAELANALADLVALLDQGDHLGARRADRAHILCRRTISPLASSHASTAPPRITPWLDSTGAPRCTRPYMGDPP